MVEDHGFRKMTCWLDGEGIHVDINIETGFISEATKLSDPDWQPNGIQRKSIVKFLQTKIKQENEPQGNR